LEKRLVVAALVGPPSIYFHIRTPPTIVGQGIARFYSSIT
jgi:hypothetical protein